jgi:hypothetical protein
MKWRRRDESYAFRELGSLEFTRLCVELLAHKAGFVTPEWREHPFGQAALSEGPVRLGGHAALEPPTLVVIAWIGDGYLRGDRGRAPLGAARGAWPAASVRSVLMLTNASADALRADDRAETVILGAAELTPVVRESTEARLRSPSVLGICSLEELIDADAERHSTGDLAAAKELSRVFVPTQAYAETLAALERYHFAFLTGPPEMGKTAVARMIGLAKLTAGWELHECVRPADLWQRYTRDRRQVFVADDAFGSTEYRPEAAERWALELDRVLRSMDESHWLLWTSRPAPLKAALRRIHREHGVERFPAPAQVQVDAASLEVAEKALILYRHGRAARLSAAATALVRLHGWHIVAHPHFTPERIRRLVASRLQRETALDPAEVDDLVELQIREPTPAMTASFDALAPEHRAVLVAMLDVPPGPVTERELITALRRHLHELHARDPRELVDRLTDHFLRLVEPAGVAWVHPSWRDLVIERLATDGTARQAFLRDCALEGMLLSLSTGGGAVGERRLPLLVADGDWDLLGDRIAALLPELDDPATVRLLTTLAEARAAASEREAAELDALAGLVLEHLRRRWAAERQVVPVGVLAAWFELAERLPQRVPPPELGPTWIERLPTTRVDTSDQSDLSHFDDWVALAALLRERRPEALAAFGFPERQADIVKSFVADAHEAGMGETPPPSRDLLIALLERLTVLVPEYAADARLASKRLRGMPADSEFGPSRRPPQQISKELRAILDAPPTAGRSDEELVARVLRDL